MALTVFVVIVQSGTTKQLHLIHGNRFISVQSIKVAHIPSKMTAVLLNIIAINDIWWNIRLNIEEAFYQNKDMISILLLSFVCTAVLKHWCIERNINLSDLFLNEQINVSLLQLIKWLTNDAVWLLWLSKGFTALGKEGSSPKAGWTAAYDQVLRWRERASRMVHCTFMVS